MNMYIYIYIYIHIYIYTAIVNSIHAVAPMRHEQKRDLYLLVQSRSSNPRCSDRGGSDCMMHEDGLSPGGLIHHVLILDQLW